LYVGFVETPFSNFPFHDQRGKLLLIVFGLRFDGSRRLGFPPLFHAHIALTQDGIDLGAVFRLAFHGSPPFVSPYLLSNPVEAKVFSKTRIFSGDTEEGVIAEVQGDHAWDLSRSEAVPSGHSG
jgi:hypothetical protein